MQMPGSHRKRSIGVRKLTSISPELDRITEAEGTLMLFKPFTQDQMHRSVTAVTGSPLEVRVA
jgi:hypothetical protein